MSQRNSISMLNECARNHLDVHTSLSGKRSFGAYDLLGDPDSFGRGDAMMPNLIGGRMFSSTVEKMFPKKANSPQSAEEFLLHAIREYLKSTAVKNQTFLDMEFDEWSEKIDPLVSAIEGVRWVGYSKLSKMLHRKRPNLVPIHDSRLRAFYSVDEKSLWGACHADWTANKGLIEEWRGDRRTADGRSLSLLRTADIVIWEHMVTGCKKSTASM